MGEVGGGHALVNAARDDRGHSLLFAAGQRALPDRIEFVQRQRQRVQHQVGGLVVGVGRAVAEEQAGIEKPLLGGLHRLAQRRKGIGGVSHGAQSLSSRFCSARK